MFKSKVKHIDTFTKPGGDTVIQLTVPKGYHLNDIKDTFDYVEIKNEPRKRSTSANAALWKMLTELAKVLNTSKEQLYEKALKEYGGVVEYIPVKPDALETTKRRLKGLYRVVVDRGVSNIKGKDFHVLECYYGSSQYTKDEFKSLLDGVIQDAKEQGIDFVSAEERELLMKEWKE